MYLNKNASNESVNNSLLTQPSVKEAPDGILDPEADYATVIIPDYSGKAVEDEIWFYWDAEVADGSTWDETIVREMTKNRPISFNVTAKYIKINEGTVVKVRYMVKRNGTEYHSEVLPLTIAQEVPETYNLQPPTIEAAINGVLNLETVPEEGAKATVPAYDQMALYDAVYIQLNDGQWEKGQRLTTPEQIGVSVDFIIPRKELMIDSGKIIRLFSRVIRDGNPVDSEDEYIRVLQPVGDLPPVSVPQARNNALDPKNVLGNSVEVIVKQYQGMAEEDVIEFTWQNKDDVTEPYRDKRTVDPKLQNEHFLVPRAQADQNTNGTAELSYTVTRGSAPSKASEPLILWIGDDFAAPAELDLTGLGYIIAKPLPPMVPSEYCFTREARFGLKPYTYKSDNTEIATVDDNGKVTVISNGLVNISATDRNLMTLSYSLTVSGVRKLFFVNASSSYSGAQDACASMNLRSVMPSEMQQFWELYRKSVTVPITDYLDWLPYLFWTGQESGAGTALAYDLNGSSINTTGRSKDDYLQVAGITP